MCERTPTRTVDGEELCEATRVCPCGSLVVVVPVMSVRELLQPSSITVPVAGCFFEQPQCV